ncbi:MAG: FAD-dependent oxidoreductase [Verrucomicrobiales bacterium]|nr:FAD-dependent oxidoreductase [Verrucomicrobiales bacterium]
MTPMQRILLPLLAGLTLATAHAAAPVYDVVVYGGTSGGVAAAVQARRMGRTVLLIEPSRRLGGLTSGGLGQTDIGNKAAIGGLARRFYRAVREHYEDPAAWKWQTAAEYRDGGQTRTAAGEDAMWTFEPGVALKIYEDWVRTHQVEVAYEERLDRSGGVALTRSIPWRILSIRLESGRTVRGKMFIDATYEGDLMAAANVSCTVGREANARYAETLNGVQTRQARYHQFADGVDPYVVPGQPESGLLPFLDPDGPGEEGAGDHRVQAYCFRMCLTDHPDNRIPFEQPAGYDPLWYELLLRNFEAGERGMPWINSAMPNRKTDTNNRTGFSTDFIGQNDAYPEASYAERAHIVAQHRLYQQGLMWTLANHPRVPDQIRNEVARWGMCRDEFVEGQGWQDQLYVREARRLVGDYVMTQHHCQGRAVADDPVGLAAYGMDSHNVQRYVDADGYARNEGDVEVGGFSPYPVSYRSIVPKARECANLLVPVCLSASHIAFGSIRMEPVFMVLGQSAATAAVQAIEEDTPVQAINYARLRERLVADDQVLVWKQSAAAN